MNEPFGPHLTLDLRQCEKERLTSVELLWDVLNDLPDVIGMTKIMPPYVVKYTDGKVADDWGISGFVMIAESHISIHTFPDKDYIFIDVFSCRDFDVDKAAKYLINAFKAKKVDRQIMKRGLDFPRNERILQKAAGKQTRLPKTLQIK